MNLAVCALYDGEYHFGLGALVNSLWHAGFRGTVFAGYRGQLPSWARCDDAGRYHIADGFELRFVFLKTAIHLANYKCDFLVRVLDDLSPGCDGVVYIDVDIVILTEWAFFEYWMTKGVAVTSDIIYFMMPSTHPVKMQWRDLLIEMGLPARDFPGYVNSGFVGVLRRHRELLDVWSLITRRAAHDGVSLDFLHVGERSHPFFAVDQDALNMALIGSSVPYSMAGAEAMGFAPGGAFMAHANSRPKPWQRQNFRRALRGLRPPYAARRYWDFVRHPIEVFSAPQRRRALAEIKVAAALARLFG
jgi:hypothetical protein